MSWFGFAIGVALGLFTWATVLKTVLLTRGGVALVERAVILGLRCLYVRIARLVRSYERQDDVLSTLAPAALLLQLAAWLGLFFLAYGLMVGPFVEDGLSRAVRVGGSSLFTLGLAAPGGSAATALIFTAAATGIVVSPSTSPTSRRSAVSSTLGKRRSHSSRAASGHPPGARTSLRAIRSTG